GVRARVNHGPAHARALPELRVVAPAHIGLRRADHVPVVEGQPHRFQERPVDEDAKQYQRREDKKEPPDRLTGAKGEGAPSPGAPICHRLHWPNSLRRIAAVSRSVASTSAPLRIASRASARVVSASKPRGPGNVVQGTASGSCSTAARISGFFAKKSARY